uniref:Peptidylprolyl isomerase domain and WD repeat containing 1 n=1 Tax=Equus asinus TaxID=9793 RepID=A0A9L0IBW2_EQUAS
MAAEGGSDSQLRRRRRRDPEEPEKTERRERELAVSVAVAQENEEENEERWVGPLPVEATLAKKRKEQRVIFSLLATLYFHVLQR